MSESHEVAQVIDQLSPASTSCGMFSGHTDPRHTAFKET